ncbi:MAG: alpha/beta hydrolase [Betaproteobacteria bacterium]|jgi:haloacetate dehalogenase|nr:alpha/beta hydrolase [Betaproteobacteria bacterium]
MLDGFQHTKIRTKDVAINVLRGGSGPPLLLLHGYPQTHVMWRKVAPSLARHFTVIATDLRGYGDSDKPHGLPDHSNYSKRAMANDQVEVMAALGFERFAVAGHDRGGRVAHRMALDHPGRVQRIAVLDIVPTRTMYARTTREFAKAYYHWFFLIQPEPFPETLIGANPEAYLRKHLGGRYAGLAPFESGGWPEYVRCFSDPAAIHATCEDYRAAESIDLEHDDADFGRRKVECPLLALWGSHGVVERCFHPLDDWREYAVDVGGKSLDCGHYLPEERPEETAQELARFFA